jgi:acetyl esterase/lipase
MHAVVLAVSFLVASEPSPKVELLWPAGAPGARGRKDRDKPAVTVYLPPRDKANGTAVIICPGGAYQLWVDIQEGQEPAQWLNHLGITAFVLRYRIAPAYEHPMPMLDAQRAVRTVRARASEWGVDPNKIGIWGFSAGGHLASTVATHFDDGNPEAKDPIDRVSSRPDFAILCYPVISMRPPLVDRPSRVALLGEQPDDKLLDYLSTDKQVTSRTPPTFLFHTDADKGVSPENSVLFYLALRHAGVPAEMHIYGKGDHGAGMAAKDPVLSSWTTRLEDWLRGRQLLPK